MATCSSLISGTVKGAVKGCGSYPKVLAILVENSACSWKQNDTRKLYLGLNQVEQKKHWRSLEKGEVSLHDVVLLSSLLSLKLQMLL